MDRMKRTLQLALVIVTLHPTEWDMQLCMHVMASYVCMHVMHACMLCMHVCYASMNVMHACMHACMLCMLA